MNIYYEQVWDVPLEDLRAEMRLPPFPSHDVARLDMAWSGEDPQPLIDHYRAAVAQIVDVPHFEGVAKNLFGRASDSSASVAAKAEDKRKRAQLFEHAIERLERDRATAADAANVVQL
jgi:hypothetical protein